MKDKDIRKMSDSILEHLRKDGFSEGGIEKYAGIYNKLIRYTDSIGIDTYSAEIGKIFLTNVYEINAFDKYSQYTIKLAIRAINILNDLLLFDFINTGKVFKSKKTELKYPSSLMIHFDNFCDFRKNEFDLSSYTIKTYQKTVHNLFDFLLQHNVDDIKLVTRPVVTNYINSCVSSSDNYLKSKFTHLKLFFQYLYENETVLEDFSKLIPKINRHRRVHLPFTLTDEQRNQVLISMKKTTQVEKRNYAMIIIAARLGLRASDIVNLKFSNINWKESTILLTMYKTKKQLILPIPNEVGEAIIDYLKSGRIKSDEPYVFIRHIPPFKKLTSASASAVAIEAVRDAKLDLPNDITTGMHLFRHTLASTLLEQNIPIETISEILGHTNVSTTSIYLHIDVENLRECSIDVPTFAWEGDDFNG